jgi:hypothetical protein
MAGTVRQLPNVHSERQDVVSERQDYAQDDPFAEVLHEFHRTPACHQDDPLDHIEKAPISRYFRASIDRIASFRPLDPLLHTNCSRRRPSATLG